MKLVSLAIVLCVVFSSTKVQAESMFRVRLYVHGSQEVGEEIDIREHFLPAALDLTEGIDPSVYLGVGVRKIEHLDIEPIVGWYFTTSEPIVGVLLSLEYWRIWMFIDLEVSLPSCFTYWFAMLTFRITDWLYTGVEGEGWGILTEGESTRSDGGGFDIIFRLEHIELDLALHTRTLEGRFIIPDFSIRVQTFF